VTYCVDDTAEILVQRRIREVGDQPEALGLAGVESSFGVSDHVLLQHGPDVAAGCGVLREDVLRSSETAFFCCTIVVGIELGAIARVLRTCIQLTTSETQ
jgi:hypothetical protein